MFFRLRPGSTASEDGASTTIVNQPVGSRQITGIVRWWQWAALAVAAFALSYATNGPTYRFWGEMAAAGYGAAAVAGVWWRAPRLSLVLATLGSVLAPLVTLILTGRSQIEVKIIERAGSLLIGSGSPYVTHPTSYSDYNPYLPGMALFGLPHALHGLGNVPADARWWFALTFVLTMAAAIRLVSRSQDAHPWWNVALLSACPLVALPLVGSGDDLAVIGLICLGLAYAGQGRSVASGLALGAAAALKWTAWPAVAVALVLLAATRGRRSMAGAGLAAIAVIGCAVVPAVALRPDTFWLQVVEFPMGLAPTASSAADPLPGHLLAQSGPLGAHIGMVLLVVAGLAVVVSLLVAPPRGTVAAADRLAGGLLLAILLMPASRFGYFVYPFVLMAWPRLASSSEKAAKATAPQPGEAVDRTASVGKPVADEGG